MGDVLLAALILAVLLVWYVWSQRRNKAAWARAADILELVFSDQDGVVRMDGMIDGFTVELYEKPVHESRDERTETVCTVTFDPTSPPIVFGHQGLTDTIFQSLGLRDDLEVGDEEFDKKVKIQAASVEQVASFLSDARKAEILRLLRHYPIDHVEMGSAGVMVQNSIFEKDTDRLVELVRRLVESAKVMRG